MINIYYSTIMKQTKLYNCLFVLAMLLMASASAMAQEFTLKAVTFLKPGEKATVAVGLKNSTDVNALQARISLPEGLTFVENASNATRFNISKTERSQGMTIALKKVNEKTAAMVCFSSTTPIAAGEGDVFTFEVNVAADYSGSKELVLSDTQIAVHGKDVIDGEKNVVSKVVDSENKVIVAGTAQPVKVGEEQTVALTLSFPKAIMRGCAFNVELPAGVTIVDNSAKVGALGTNHKINLKNGLFTINFLDFSVSDAFSANEGELCTFNIKADENFVEGSEIKVKNIKTWAHGGHDEYYAEDFAIKLTKGDVTGINGVTADELGADAVYQLNGVRTDQMKQGVNIVVKNVKAIKVLKK